MAKFCKAGIKTGVALGLFGFDKIWVNNIIIILRQLCTQAYSLSVGGDPEVVIT